MKYEWEPDLETGHLQIDNQHKQLFSTLNSIITESKKPKLSEGFIFTTVRFLINYTVVHFETEEQLMLKYGYKDFAVHKKQHEDFKKAAKNLYKTLEKKGASNALMQELIATVGNWLLIHIKGDDQKMAFYVKARDINNQWSPSLEIGDKNFDDQNKQVFITLNKYLTEILKPEVNHDNIIKTVDFLMSYIIVHFCTEEHLMERYGYSNYITHKNIHEKIIKAVRDLNLCLINTGPADALLQEKISNIFRYLLDHIKGEDQKAALFIKHSRDRRMPFAA